MMGKYLVEINEQTVFINTTQLMRELEQNDVVRCKSINEE